MTRGEWIDWLDEKEARYSSVDDGGVKQIYVFEATSYDYNNKHKKAHRYVPYIRLSHFDEKGVGTVYTRSNGFSNWSNDKAVRSYVEQRLL